MDSARLRLAARPLRGLAAGSRDLARLRLATHALRSFLEESDPAHPRLSASTPKIGGDNPDYVCTQCVVSGRFEYRLRGERGDAHLQVCNHWLESLAFLEYTTHLNHHTATARPDGSVRVVIARRDPGLPNWIDTAGHARGAIALRRVNADRDSQPRTRVARLSDLAAARDS